MKHLTLCIRGHVQDVGFRAGTCREARRLGITGSVQNQPDGSVLVEAEGDEVSLQKLIAWCHQGPKKAAVERVVVEEGSLQHFSSFNIKYTP